MESLLPNPQYVHQLKKGDKVNFWNKTYRIQEYKGWLHIVIDRNGQRQKIGVADLCKEPGSLQDWIFNGWSQVYGDYDQFRAFVDNEMLCAN